MPDNIKRPLSATYLFVFLLLCLAYVLKENLGHDSDTLVGGGMLILGFGAIIVAWKYRAASTFRPHRFAAIGVMMVLIGIDRILTPFGDNDRIAWTLSALFAVWLILSKR